MIANKAETERLILKFRTELHSIYDVTFNVSHLLEAVFADRKREASSETICCGSSSMIAFVEMTKQSVRDLDKSSFWEKRNPKDIDLVCGNKVFSQIASWTIESSYNINLQVSGLQINSANSMRLIYLTIRRKEH